VLLLCKKKILLALITPKIWGLKHDSSSQFMKGVAASKFCALLLDTCRPFPSNSATDREEKKKKKRIGAPKGGGAANLHPLPPPFSKTKFKNRRFCKYDCIKTFT
jgi:hypothetical protein